MQARWLVGGALLVLATSVAEAQPGDVAPSPAAAPPLTTAQGPVVGPQPAPVAAPDADDTADDTAAEPLPAPKPQARPAPSTPPTASPSAPPAAYPPASYPPGYPPAGYPPAGYPPAGYPPVGYWQPGAYPATPMMLMPAEERTEDYRLQLVVADLAGVAAIGVARGNGVLLALGNYVVTPMIIHGAHGEGTRVAASVGLRVGLPLLGGLLGSLHSDPNYCRDPYYDGTNYEYYDDCGDNDGTIALGVGLGVLAAIIIDDGFLGRSHRIEKPRPSWSPRVSVAPTRDHQVGQINLGVAGQF